MSGEPSFACVQCLPLVQVAEPPSPMTPASPVGSAACGGSVQAASDLGAPALTQSAKLATSSASGGTAGLGGIACACKSSTATAALVFNGSLTAGESRSL